MRENFYVLIDFSNVGLTAPIECVLSRTVEHFKENYKVEVLPFVKMGSDFGSKIIIEPSGGHK